MQKQLQPVLEEWVGRPLVLQRCHGIREYRRGGFLKRHVDWPLSHVVAVILNVAQVCEERTGARSLHASAVSANPHAKIVEQDVDEEWPLMIEDHEVYDTAFPRASTNVGWSAGLKKTKRLQGKEHRLEMAPGEMVLYEAARLVHGRPIPLNGSSCAQLTFELVACSSCKFVAARNSMRANTHCPWRSYANLFVHFKPTEGWISGELL